MFLPDMVHKPTAISVIAAVVVAGILTLSVLAAISSTNQAFAQAKKPTSLSIGTYPCCERKTLNPTGHASFSGKLYTEGSEGPGGALYILLESQAFGSSQLMNSVAILLPST
jgi:hypothetical protein